MSPQIDLLKPARDTISCLLPMFQEPKLLVEGILERGILVCGKGLPVRDKLYNVYNYD
jgi:hypothetical protein